MIVKKNGVDYKKEYYREIAREHKPRIAYPRREDGLVRTHESQHLLCVEHTDQGNNDAYRQSHPEGLARWNSRSRGIAFAYSAWD